MEKFNELFELIVTDEDVAKEFIMALENQRLSEFAGRYGVSATEEEAFKGMHALISGQGRKPSDDDLNASHPLGSPGVSAKTDIMADFLYDQSKKHHRG